MSSSLFFIISCRNILSNPNFPYIFWVVRTSPKLSIQLFHGCTFLKLVSQYSMPCYLQIVKFMKSSKWFNKSNCCKKPTAESDKHNSISSCIWYTTCYFTRSVISKLLYSLMLYDYSNGSQRKQSHLCHRITCEKFQADWAFTMQLDGCQLPAFKSCPLYH